MIDWQVSDPLTNLGHIDGRNATKLYHLRPYFSELAWLKTRLLVMVRYLAAVATVLDQKPSPQTKRQLNRLIGDFSLRSAREVKQLEKITNHDLKALELYLARRILKAKLKPLTLLINIGIGSEDINNVALALSLLGSRGEVVIPELIKLVKPLIKLIEQEKETWMVARTHAVPAGVTTLGKELASTLLRLCDEVEIFQQLPLQAKFSGEVGTWQALNAVDQKQDWIVFTDRFLASFRLVSVVAVTQIAPYESMVRYLQSLFRVNSVLLDFCRNLWLYVLLDYLKIEKVETEVGSAGMPHKVNPIYFEGAEGGLVMANGVIETLCRALPVNRLQRDFSDSTLRRNLVLPFAYSLLSYQSLTEGLRRTLINHQRISRDLADHPEVWLETVKVLGLQAGISDIYERLKQATRGRRLTKEDLLKIGVDWLPVRQQQGLEKLMSFKLVNPYPRRIVDAAVKRAKQIFRL